MQSVLNSTYGRGLEDRTEIGSLCIGAIIESTLTNWRMTSKRRVTRLRVDAGGLVFMEVMPDRVLVDGVEPGYLNGYREISPGRWCNGAGVVVVLEKPAVMQPGLFA